MFDVLIIGSGVAGLSTALHCQQQGLSVQILEAASRIGGRVHSVYSSACSSETPLDKKGANKGDNNAEYLADLGPTWVWPPYQASVQDALQAHNLQLMDQYNTGAGIVERPDSAPAKHQLPGQHGMSRLRGGPQSLVNALANSVGTSTIAVDNQVEALTDKTKHIEAVTSRRKWQARCVVIAAPLRIAVKDISYSPPLSDKHRDLMQSSATWMASHAKAVLIYQRAFWREANLSGRVASQIGPLVEVNDHCGEDGTPAALFGFIGVPAATRAEHSEQLVDAIKAQMIRCFGEQAAHPQSIVIQDWATNPYICTQRDIDETPQHPGVLPDLIRQSSWDGRLFFAAAETSAVSPGLLDGALDAAQKTAQLLCKLKQPN